MASQSQEEIIRELRDRLATQEQIVQSCYQRLADKPRGQQQAEAELESIRKSRAFRIAGWIQRVARPLLPGLRLIRSARRVQRESGFRGLVARMWRRLRHGRGGPDVGIQFRLDRKFPTELAIGLGNHLILSGWCFHPHCRVSGYRLIRDGQPISVVVERTIRSDVTADIDPFGYGREGGFFVVVPLAPNAFEATATFELEVRLRNGQSCRMPIGSITLYPNVQARTPAPVVPCARDLGPMVAICMAAHNPPPELFARQIASIKAQSHRNWICIITDDSTSPEARDRIIAAIGGDARFHVYANSARLGFYRNFERCLSLVPPNADFVALADQDDEWRPNKLATLLQTFDAETTLVYSDMRIVTADGRVIADTYWTTRRNNFTDLAALGLVNTVTGASSMFRRRILSHVLPFPDRPGDQYHDHWIAIVAASLGAIRYVARPLYDYTQHGANVIGHFGASHESPLDHLYSHYRAIREKLRLAQTRCGSLVETWKRREFDRIANCEQCYRSRLWLLYRWLSSGDARVTMNAERDLLRSLVWRRNCRLRLLWSRWQRGGWFGPKPLPKALPKVQPAEWLDQKIAPLSLRVSATAPKRVNLLIGILDFRFVFGGYITVFHLARRLVDCGRSVRFVIVDECPFEPQLWRKQFRSLHGLEDLLDHAEVVYAHDRAIPIDVHPEDQWLATSWWTAHIAHKAAADLRRSSIVYLSQDYEPVFYPMGSLAALANESYQLPHLAVFSTELLRDYFRANRLGVYQRGPAAGDQMSIAFENAITPVEAVKADDLIGRSSRKLLFYARPEAHNARNLFEIGIMALGEAIRTGVFTDEWEFWGIGCSAITGQIALSETATMQVLPRQDLGDYAKTLRTFDVGLSLMYTPHPSLVPMEMASAGMLTVTNTFATKTAERIEALSSNLIPVETSVAAIVDGLRRAVAGVKNADARVQGSHVNWSTNWLKSFSPPIMSQICTFLDAGDPIFVARRDAA